MKEDLEANQHDWQMSLQNHVDSVPYVSLPVVWPNGALAKNGMHDLPFAPMMHREVQGVESTRAH